jgi:hypothetical protein
MRGFEMGKLMDELHGGAKVVMFHCTQYVLADVEFGTNKLGYFLAKTCMIEKRPLPRCQRSTASFLRWGFFECWSGI